MSRHRAVRTMNYEDEYFDDDDEDYYSRSIEDNYGVSPATAAEFTYQRDRNVDFSSFMRSESITEEEETTDDNFFSDACRDELDSSGNGSRVKLSHEDQARLNSCIEELHNVLGDSVPESVMSSVIIQNNFSIETSLNQLLDAPKPQREPRKQRNRSQDDIENDKPNNFLSEVTFIEGGIDNNVIFKASSPGCKHMVDQSPHLVSSCKTKENDSDIFYNMADVENKHGTFYGHRYGTKDNGKENLGTNEKSKLSFSHNANSKKSSNIIISKEQSSPQYKQRNLKSGLSEQRSSKDSKQGLSLADLARQHKSLSPPSNSQILLESAAYTSESGFYDQPLTRGKSSLDSGKNVLASLAASVSSSVSASCIASSLHTASSPITSLSTVSTSQMLYPVVSTSPKVSTFLMGSKSPKVSKSLSMSDPANVLTPSFSSAPPMTMRSSMAQPMANLSTLVAQHSAKKSSSPIDSTNTLNLNFGARDKLKSPQNNQGIQKSSPNLSLVKPTSNKTKMNSNPGISLGELAQQYKSMSMKSSEGKVASGINNSTVSRKDNSNSDLSDKIGEISLKEIIESSRDFSKPSPMSLTKCLKTSGPLTGIKEINKAKKNDLKHDSKSIKNASLPVSMPEVIIPTSVTSSLQAPDPKLVATASPIGLALCEVHRKRKLDGNYDLCLKHGCKYPRFLCNRQLGRLILYAKVKISHINKFDFSTPSPDDIVKSKQKLAFTRSNKEFQI